jgi:hypothetical protein
MVSSDLRVRKVDTMCRKDFTGYSRGTCTPMFIAALVTIAKLWKQPRCPTSDE